MNYSELNLNIDKDTILIEQLNINVLKYLPIEDKNDIVQIALQNAEENGIYNEFKLDMHMKLYAIYMYTDLEFTDEEKSDPVKLFDELESNGIIDTIVKTIPSREWNYLYNVLYDTKTEKLKYRNTIASVINNFMENLPANANAAKDIIEKFNPEDFQQVIDFARAANGGRDI